LRGLGWMGMDMYVILSINHFMFVGVVHNGQAKVDCYDN
jgi:hypothetical protein